MNETRQVLPVTHFNGYYTQLCLESSLQTWKIKQANTTYFQKETNDNVDHWN